MKTNRAAVGNVTKKSREGQYIRAGKSKRANGQRAAPPASRQSVRAIENPWAELEHARLLDILDSSLNEIYIFDAETLRFEYVNAGALRNLGYTIEQLRGMTPLDLKPEFTEAAFREMLEPLIRGEKEMHVFCTMHRRADASLYPVEVHLQLAEFNGGRVFLAVILDITERKRAEQALRESEEQFRNLFENAPIGIGVSDMQGKLLAFNNAMLKPGGYSREDILQIGSVAALYYDPKQREEALALFRKQGFLHSHEVNFKRKDGTPYKAMLSLTMTTFNGQPCIQAIVEDITERKQAEDALRESEGLLRESQIIAGLGTYVLDIPSGRWGSSPVLDRIFGIDETFDHTVEGWTALLHPEDRQQMIDYFRNAVLGKRTRFDREYRIVRNNDKAERWVHGLGELEVDSKNQLVRMRGTIQDITERKWAEDALRQAEAKYRALVERLPVVVYTSELGVNGAWSYVSPQIERMLGFTPQEWMADPGLWYRQMHPEDRVLHETLEEQAYENGTAFENEYRMFTRDGREIWVRDSGLILRSKNEAAPIVQGILMDVTERRQVEELQAALLRIAKAANSARDLNELYLEIHESLRGVIVAENFYIALYDAAANLLSFPYYVDEYDAPPEGAAPLDRGLTSYVIRTGMPLLGRPDKIRQLEESGEVEPVGTTSIDWLGVPLKIQDRIIGAMAVQSYKEGIRYSQRDLDILNFVSSQAAQSIARKQSEEALRAGEESFRGLFNSVAEAIYIQDADGRFLDVNEGAVKMYGYPREFFIGKTPEPLSAPGKNDLAKIAKAVKAAYDGQPQQFEFWGLRANGEVFPKDVRLYKGAYFGRDVVIALAQDITERKQAEEKIARRLAELEALYQSGIGFSQTLDQRDIAEKVIEVLMGRLNWHHAAVRVRRENSDEVELLAFSRSDEHAIDNTWAKSVITHVGQGMAGWVIEHGEIVRSGNVNEDPRYVETFAGMKSGLYIPMKIHNRTIGCISVESEQPDAFTEDDERLMLTLAVQASSAIENARLYESALLSAQRRGVLYQAGQDMVRIRQDLEQVYMAVHHAVSQLMATEAFTIALLDEANNEVEGVYLYDKGGRWPSQRVPLGKGFSSRVILSGKTLLITDIEKTPVEAVHFGTQEQIRSVLAVPMFIGGKAIGAIAAQSYQPNAYTAEDQRLLEMLATQASIAIENARLFAQTEARAREFSSLYAVAADLASSNDLNALLNTIAGNVASLLNATGGAVYLFRPEINELEVVADTYDKISIGTRLELGEGMAGRVAESRQPMMIDDYERWEGHSPKYEGFSYSAVLEVPMIYSGELVGVLTAYHVHSSDPSATENRKFNENDMRLLSLFASHAAGAVYSARLFEAERRRRQDAETLRQAAATLSSSLDLEQVLDNLLNGIAQVIPYTSSSVFILQGEFVRIVAARGFAHPENVVGHSFPAQNGLCRAIFETRRPLILADAQTDPRFENWTHEPHIRGWMGVPLIAHGEIIGHLTLDSDQPDAYTPHDAEMALAFASQAAAAIVNARLFDQLNQRLRQLSGLHAIDMAISSSTDLSVILDVVANNTINLLKVDAAAVLLYDPVLQLLKFKSGAGFQTGEIGRASLHLGEGLAGRAALHRENVHVPNDFASRAEPERRPLVEREGFTAYSCAPLIAKGELKGVLEIFHRSPLELNADSKEFLNVLAGQAAIAIDSAGMFENLQASNTELMLAYDATIEGWSRALDLRDQETEGHTQRVTSMTMELARAMGIPESEMVHIRRGGLLHDMGKLGIPDAILLKPGALTEEEWNLMRKHPQYAYDMLSPIKFLRPALEIPYCHHEKWDGTGYPRGLKGEQIPIAARVFAVTDVWDALCSDRPYRPAWPREKALEHIKSLSGIHFDPRVVEAFLKLLSEKEEGD